MQDLLEMAKAAGQSFPDFTPPDGETHEQVRLLGCANDRLPYICQHV